MKSEILIAIKQLAAEKNLSEEAVFQIMEAALASAYKKQNGGVANVTVTIDRNTGFEHVYVHKLVTGEVTDPRVEVSLEEARQIKPDATIGETISVPDSVRDAGRIAAQTAKQVLLQREREAQAEQVYEEFAEREGDIVSGVVQRVEAKQAVIDLGRAEAILPQSEQLRTERYRPGQRIKGYLLEVHRTGKGTQLVISRTHKNFLKRLFELEVPEIHRGVVEIKSIAREPGYRSKVAVAARQEGIDPVGACVGLRGIRIQNIVNELGGERIDVIQWDPDPARFVANALSPAQALSVTINEEEKTAMVIVPDRQLSLAIGKEGQNARLAAKLTGWRIDIKSQSIAEQEAEVAGAPVAAATLPPTETAPVSPPEPETEVTPEPEPAPEPVVASVEQPVAAEPAPVPVAEEEVEREPAPVTTGVTERVSTVRFAEEVLAGPTRATPKGKKAKGSRGLTREEEEAEARRRKARRSERRPIIDEEDLEDFDL